MKILILSQWFDPETCFKGALFARELIARGHQVEVLTGFPNYPGGKVYPGYRIRPWMRDEVDGVDVVRVALYPSHNASPVQRALNYLSFAASAVLFGTFLIRKPDVIYVYHPPITAGLAAMAIGLLRRAPFVYDVNDLWPDTVAASGMVANLPALGMLRRLCGLVYRRASRIAAVTPGFKNALIWRGVPAKKIDLIYNWADESLMKSTPGADPLSSPGRLSILFAGTMGLAQGLESVLLAARICASTVPAADFVFIGGGVESAHLEQMAAANGLDNVRFLPRRPMHQMGELLASADILLAHLKDDPLFRITIPSKTQTYMAAGKPILMAVAGDTADLIERAQCGVLAQPGNPQSIADAVKELYEAGPARRAAMGRRGREFYERELSASAGADRFDTVLRKAASQAKQLRQRGWRLMLKRALDISVAGAGLILLAPVLAGVAALVWLSMRSPILFRQERPGRFGKPMRVLKFRSMSAETDGSGVLLPDAMRLTAAGRLLRSTSLDELPQLWNVLKGDLSLVGPRPLLTEYLPRYSERQATRHDVLPGITGWAQINGRNDLSWNAKLALDAWYVEHWTLLLDLKILALTLPRVLQQHGISRSGHATTPGFLDEGE